MGTKILPGWSLFVFTLLVPVVALKAQSDANLVRLQRENDSLRIELLKCKGAPLQRLTESLDSPKFGENPIYSREELQAKLLPQIRLKSEEKYNAALNAIAATDRFIEYCEAAKLELFERTGGLDPKTGQMAGARNKEIPTKFFIEEKRGAELMGKITELRALYLKSIQNDPNYTSRITLNIEAVPSESRAKSWEAFKFEGMPLAAVFPILGKLESDAKGSEAAVLQYLNE